MASRLLTLLRSRRLLLLTTAGISAATIALIAVATHGFGLVESKGPADIAESQRRTAQGRCESAVFERLAAPSEADLSNVVTARSVLEPDSRDLFPLLDDPLKGVDRSRVTVWNVSGIADAQNAFGSTIHDRFTCRAYFIDADLATTLVVFDHDH